MKRINVFILILILVAMFSACGKEENPQMPNTQPPSVMYDGVIYRTTGKQLPGEVDESAILGYIHSVVHGSQLPQEEGQSNFPAEGAAYAIVSDGFVVLMDNEWTIFEPLEIPVDQE